MDMRNGTARARKMIVPTAVGAAGAAAGWVLTRKPKQGKPKQLRNALPELPNVSVGDIADDLRGRVESALGRGGSDGEGASASAGRHPMPREQLEARRHEREQRRKQRRQRSRR